VEFVWRSLVSFYITVPEINQEKSANLFFLGSGKLATLCRIYTVYLFIMFICLVVYRFNLQVRMNILNDVVIHVKCLIQMCPCVFCRHTIRIFKIRMIDTNFDILYKYIFLLLLYDVLWCLDRLLKIVL